MIVNVIVLPYSYNTKFIISIVGTLRKNINLNFFPFDAVGSVPSTARRTFNASVIMEKESIRANGIVVCVCSWI